MRCAKSFHGCALPHPTARSLKTAKGELASLSNAQIGFPDLDPASRTKLRYRFLCQVSLSLACRPTQLHVWLPNNGVHLWHDQEDVGLYSSTPKGAWWASGCSAASLSNTGQRLVAPRR